MKTNQLSLGTAKVDITPAHPVPLAGFSERNGLYRDIHRKLFARVWFFKQTETTGTVRNAVLVQADLIWWGSDVADALIRDVRTRWRTDTVILHASHTHSGPQTTEKFTSYLGRPDPDYIRYVKERVLAGIEAAERDTEPVVISKASGRCHIAVNRRKRCEDGSVGMAPNPDGPVDPEVLVVKFAKPDGVCKGVLFHYACHPTTTRDNFVSSEFPGAAMEAVESAFPHPVVASFLQGCCGDVRPALVREGQFVSGTREDVDTLGRTLADEVLRVLNGPMDVLSPSLGEMKRVEIELPVGQVPDEQELKAAASKEGVFAEWARLLLDDPERRKPTVPLRISLLPLADALALLAIDAEAVVEYGLAIKRLSRGRVLPLPYSNGMIGYLPTARQIEEGGYESRESLYFFGLPGPFSGRAERLVMERIAALING
jgi:Neutral/alkaline non-lysosomal ceramidase.